VPLDPAQAHYLFGVMRLGMGAEVELFNGRDGAWRAQVAEAGKKRGLLACRTQAGLQQDPPDLWLLFAPLKKARTDFVVEKATELGARRICPVQTEFTNAERIRRDRLQATAVEAAEQCGGTFVPEVTELVRLDRLLADWPEGRALLVADEALAGTGKAAPAGRLPRAPAAMLIGPEGGFSEAERARFDARPNVARLRLGQRILRAETAAVAALTLWQADAGDWG